MSAYVIVDVEPHDLETYQEYRKLAPATVHAYGGKYLVRGNTIEHWEGQWTPKYIAVLEFESFDRAKAWYESAEYGAVKPMRQRSTRSNMILVDGVVPGAIAAGNSATTGESRSAEDTRTPGTHP